MRAESRNGGDSRSMSTNRSHGAGPLRIAATALLAALTLAAWEAPAQAASFDCAKAATVVEKTICGDAGLSRLDEALGESYAEALAQAADPAALKSEQRAWLRETRDACADVACLKAVYEVRIAVLAIAGEAAAGVGKPLVLLEDHPIPSPQPQQAVGFHLDRGSDEKMCQGVDRGLREHGLIPGSWQLCGVPFPSDDPDFDRLDPWRDLAPAEHMDLVWEIFYWFSLRNEIFGTNNVNRQMPSATILPDLMKLIRGPSQGFIQALVDAGRLSLQVNRFDYDNNGVDETVYRMTGVKSGVRYRDGGYVMGPPYLILKSCREAVPGWPDIPYIHAIEIDGELYVLESRSFPSANFSFFRYDGRTYSARNGWGEIWRSIPIRPAPAGPAMGRPICSFSVY